MRLTQSGKRTFNTGIKRNEKIAEFYCICVWKCMFCAVCCCAAARFGKFGGGKDDGSGFKAALLSGPPGVGKTTTAALVCEVSLNTHTHTHVFSFFFFSMFSHQSVYFFKNHCTQDKLCFKRERFAFMWASFWPFDCVCMWACRSWASASWRWTPAVLAAKTVWRKSSQSHLTTPASRVSTKVIPPFIFVTACYTFELT